MTLQDILNRREDVKFSEIPDRKNILKKFQKKSRKQPKFFKIAEKFPKVPSGENLQV